MNKLNFITKATSILEKHSPEILTVTCIAGIATAAVSSHEAARKSRDKSLKEAWPNYILPAVSVSIAIGSVIGLNFSHKKHYAALLATYAVTQADNESFKKKISDILGKEKVEKTELEVQKERVSNLGDDPYNPEDIIDKVTGVKLNTSKIAILQASNMVNNLLHDSIREVRLTEFYDFLGVIPDEIPEIAERIIFDLEHPMRIEFGGLTGRNFKTYATFYYNYNYEPSNRSIPWE